MKGRAHGAGDRSIFKPQSSIDVKLIDDFIASGGRDPDAARFASVNALFGPNRFGKMFPDLSPFRPDDSALEDLGRAMVETAPEDPGQNLSNVPAGFTYLGQFIDHDLSFDKTALEGPINDPEQMEQARTPTLELDSLYGLGPVHNPEFYDPHPPPPRALFRIGRTSSIPSSGGIGQPDLPVSLPHDLPRGEDRLAIIADERNDENTIVAQTHLAFLKFHNAVSARGPQRGPDGRGGPPFERAQQAVRWHYQWIILHDFLPKIADPDVITDVRTNGRHFYKFDRDPFNGRPFMPLEFSAAAYRMGHSMIRETYNFNRVFAHRTVEPTALIEATLELLFAFTGSGRFLPAGPDHTSLPSNWIIDWRRFFPVGDPQLLNFARKIDTHLVPQLHRLPGAPPGRESLAVRNLLRGSRVGLPTGQDVAQAIGATALTPDEVASGADGPVLREHGLHDMTPLWYYVLKEAEIQSGGLRLGHVGSRIVGEVFYGLLEGDRTSYLSVNPGWKPTLPATTPGSFSMSDLLRFVNELNPVG